LFAAQSLCPANRTEPRAAIILPDFVRSYPALQQKLAMPLQWHLATIVLPLSPEAVLLTGKRKIDQRFCCAIKRNPTNPLIRKIMVQKSLTH